MPMSRPTSALLAFVAALLCACHTTHITVRSVETVVLEDGLTYGIVASVPSSLKVKNVGDATVVVSVREQPRGLDVETLRLEPGTSGTTHITLANYYVVLTASPQPSFVHLSVRVVHQEGQPSPVPPTLAFYNLPVPGGLEGETKGESDG